MSFGRCWSKVFGGGARHLLWLNQWVGGAFLEKKHLNPYDSGLLFCFRGLPLIVCQDTDFRSKTRPVRFLSQEICVLIYTFVLPNSHARLGRGGFETRNPWPRNPETNRKMFSRDSPYDFVFS